MIRAGISGTNWTGKSATIRSFVESHRATKVETIALSTLGGNCPHPMVEEQTADASRWMLNELAGLLERPSNADVQLFDRTPIDILAFTQYAFDRQAACTDEALIKDITELLPQYNTIFYARISDHWPLGTAPPPNEVAFALLMDRYMKQLIARLEVEVVWLPEELRERVQVITGHLGL